MKKFWNWTNQTDNPKENGRTLFLNGTIADESWYDDDVTPQLFKDDLYADSGDVTVWLNSPGGDCVAAAQIYNMLKEYTQPSQRERSIILGIRLFEENAVSIDKYSISKNSPRIIIYNSKKNPYN